MSYKRIWSVITDSGDGSNNIEWVTDPKVLEKMEQLADDGNEAYASGDGLQVREFKFPDDFDLDAWIELNFINVVTLEDITRY